MYVTQRSPTTTSVDYEAVVRTHQAGIWRFLRFLGAEPDLADDLVQETFLATFRSGFEERHERATAAYLRRVARHRFLNAVRAKRTRPRFEHLEEAEASWVGWTGTDDGQSRRDALRRCLGRLRERARRAIDLAYTEGRSRVEVAASLQMTVDGVKTLLRRARQALKTCVEREVAR